MEKNLNVKRAFLLSATLPGAGEWYAGKKSSGLFAATAILASLIVFGASAASTVQKALNHLGASLDGASANTLDVPIVTLAAAMLVAYGMWLHTMYGAVEAAAEKDESKRTCWWALMLSYVCPGTGQLYTGSPFWGQVIFYTFFMGVILSLSSYRGLINDLQSLAQGGALAGATPHTVPQLLALPLARVNYSIGQSMQSLARMSAIYLSFRSLGVATKLPFGQGLVGIIGTWFCPGAGHLLIKHEKWGSRLFKFTAATMFIFVLMVKANHMPATWLLSSLTWAAIIHYLYLWQTMEKCQTRLALCHSDVGGGEELSGEKAINKEFNQGLSIGTACAS